MKFIYKIILIFVIFLSSSVIAKKNCFVKDYQECLLINGKLTCDEDIYFKKTKNYLQFDDPPILEIKIYKEFDGYKNIFPVIPNIKSRGYIIFESSNKFNDKFYKNLYGFTDGHKNKINIYDQWGRVIKYMIFDKNNFILNEYIDLFHSNEHIVRVSSGKCNE